MMNVVIVNTLYRTLYRRVFDDDFKYWYEIYEIVDNENNEAANEPTSSSDGSMSYPTWRRYNIVPFARSIV